MPHHAIHFTPAGQAALARVNKSLEQFAFDMESIVANVFNDNLGESLIPGRTVVTDAMVSTNSMPVDLHLTCTAWATPDRSADVERLESTLREQLAKYYEVNFGEEMPKHDSHLNIVGLP